MATAGGLVFIGATLDGKFRAFESKTGKLLWEANVDAPAHSIPGVQFRLIDPNGVRGNGSRVTSRDAATRVRSAEHDGRHRLEQYGRMGEPRFCYAHCPLRPGILQRWTASARRKLQARDFHKSGVIPIPLRPSLRLDEGHNHSEESIIESILQAGKSAWLFRSTKVTLYLTRTELSVLLVL